ncbi:MAG: cysteine desulfurase [Parcubacteria group bacterium Gr01-1014_2]|nr:MAG: cysteine desulfurase [Parcubacteria group bacterium Gr01-1014_2]
MREVYLDNAATTPCDQEVLKAMAPFWSKIYGNPSSFNDAGREAKKALDQSRQKIARILGAKNQEIIFTSSATEANNLAILGTIQALKNKKSKIITTKIEHQSVLGPIKKLEKEGIKIHYLSVNEEGLIDLNEFKKNLTPDTVLISIIYANNETGSVQLIKKLAKIIKEFKKNSQLTTHNLQLPYFHIDAAQAGSLDINVNNLGVDLMTVSSHKIYGPKGIALLYAKRETKIEPLTYGGGQEFNLRPATEAIPLIVGFAKALEITNNLQQTTYNKQEKLKEYFINKLKELFPIIKINGPENQQNRIPHIINVTLPGIENEQLLLHLDKYGIRASAGSACTSKEIEPSHVLLAIGLSKEEARSSIRFSFGKTSKADLDYVLKILPKVVKKIKELYPKDLKKYYYGRTN